MRMRNLIKAGVVAANLLAATALLHAQQSAGTAFTYQGRLTSGGEPLNGSANLRFELWDAPMNGTPLGAVNLGPTPVADGLFSAPLDFGAQPFSSNGARWLQVVVDGTPLSPRQALTAAPFSLATRGIDVDAGGNVTLGAGSPGVQFNLFTGQGTGWINFGSDMNFDGGGDGVFYFRNTGFDFGRTAFVTGNDEHLTIRNNGRIGIGETDPSHQLVVRATGDADAVYAVTHASSGEHYAISGQTWSPSGAAIRGDGAAGATGVYGSSNGGVSVFGDGSFGAAAVGGYFRSYGESGKGVHGAAYAASGPTYGVLGEAASPDGFGVYSLGKFAATGTTSFQIDHPLDPDNKLLNHYCAEGPDPLNVYSGIVTLDATGVAWIELPDYFSTINRDCRYQLTPIGAAMPNLHVADEVTGNRFRIASGAPGKRVSWQVSAIRDDVWVKSLGAPVEVEKSADQRGRRLSDALRGSAR